MSNADHNHTEEMERDFHEAYTAISRVSNYFKGMSFEDFQDFIKQIDGLKDTVDAARKLYATLN